MPIFDTEGVKTTYYVTPAHLDYPDFVTPEQLAEIAGHGHEIGNHTVNHADLTTLSSSAARAEVNGAKTTLTQLGYETSTLAYPYGATNASVENIVRNAGYIGARGTDNGFADKNTDRYNLPSWDIGGMTFADVQDIIDSTIAQKKWAILIVHKVDVAGDPESVDSAVLQQAIDYLQEKQVEMVTNKEGFAKLSEIE